MRIVPLLAKLSFTSVVLALAVGLTAALGTRLELWAFPFGLLKLFPWCIYLGILGFVLGLVWLVWSRVAKGTASSMFGWIGLIGAIAVLALPLYNIYVAKSVPPIHDISTDTENPPQFVALLPLRKGAMNPPQYEGGTPLMWNGEKMTAAEAQKMAYPDIKTRGDLTTPQKEFDRALEAAKDMGWTIVAVDEKDGRIEAYDRTLFFGFTDDIVIRVKPSGAGAKLDIRSKSRVGMSDIGKNAARIRAYMKELAAS